MTVVSWPVFIHHLIHHVICNYGEFYRHIFLDSFARLLAVCPSAIGAVAIVSVCRFLCLCSAAYVSRFGCIITIWLWSIPACGCSRFRHRNE